MAATIPSAAATGDLEALRRLAKAEPFEFLTADGELAEAARAASRHLFSALAPLCPKLPFDSLLVDGFDAEQIWQQIDLQTRDLVPSLRRRLNQFKRKPDGIGKLLKSKNDGNLKVGDEGVEEFEEEVSGDEEEEEEEGRGGGVEEVEEMEDEEEEDEGEEEEGDGLRDVEDQFLKIKDQERFFEKREKEEFGEESGEDDGDDGEDGEDDEDNEDEFMMDDIRYHFIFRYENVCFLFVSR